jgi:hypothetical protein
MRKQSLIIFFCIGIFTLFPVIKVLAVAPTLDPNEVVFDYQCKQYVLLSKQWVFPDGKPRCNEYCERHLIYTNGSRNTMFCTYGSTGTTEDQSTLMGLGTIPEFFVPQEDAALIYLRSGLFVTFGLSGLLLVLYGLYGWYVRSMSGGNPDKVALSMSIFKNALIGGVLVVVAVVIVQLVYSFMGITQGAFDFNFIPKIGTNVLVDINDVGRKCYSNQTDLNLRYTCVDGKWQ